MDIQTLRLENYCEELPKALQPLFSRGKSVLEVFHRLPAFVDAYFKTQKASKPHPALKRLSQGEWLAIDFFHTEEPWIDLEQKIYLGPGLKIEPGALFKPRVLLLGPGEVRQAAYVREETIAAEGCVIGHATETKGSVLLAHVEVGHFNYIGNSLIGAFSNLGAGAKLANLEFRTRTAKRNQEFPEIYFEEGGQRFQSGFSKFGSVLGEGGELGCNGVLAPGCFIGMDSRILPNFYVPKGVYPARSFLAPLPHG